METESEAAERRHRETLEAMKSTNANIRSVWWAVFVGVMVLAGGGTVAFNADFIIGPLVILAVAIYWIGGFALAVVGGLGGVGIINYVYSQLWGRKLTLRECLLEAFHLT